MSLKVAVAGASGIGKHHAKWFDRWGCQVVGFLGTSEPTCRATEQKLRELFPFTGRGYTDFASLLGDTHPDVVDVCTPNGAHYEIAAAALDAGCHVLCEKPLIWEDSQDDILARAGALVARARASQKLLGVATQYAAAPRAYDQLYGSGARNEPPAVTEMYAEMETLSRGRQRDANDIWVDMGPHPLSLLLAWFPEGSIDTETLSVQFSGTTARARFDFCDTVTRCHVDITARDKTEGPPVRRFGLNGYLVDCSGRPDAAGTYCSVLSDGSREVVVEDFMSYLIQQFCEAVSGAAAPLVSGEVGLRNLELQLQVLRSASACCVARPVT